MVLLGQSKSTKISETEIVPIETKNMDKETKIKYQRKQATDFIIKRMDTFIDKGYLVENELLIILFFVEAHLKRYGYAERELPFKPIPPG